MQDFGRPPVDPLGDPPGDPFFEDPFEALSRVLGNPTDSLLGGGGVCPPNPDFFMDPLGQTLSRLEESIEGMTEAPPPKFEEPLVSPEPPALIIEGGYRSKDPPPPPEGTEHPWNTLQPPPAARLYRTPDGIMSPFWPSRHRPGHAGTGIRNANPCTDQPRERYCELEEDWVPLITCTEKCRFYDEDKGLCTYDYDNEES